MSEVKSTPAKSAQTSKKMCKLTQIPSIDGGNVKFPSALNKEVPYEGVAKKGENVRVRKEDLRKILSATDVNVLDKYAAELGPYISIPAEKALFLYYAESALVYKNGTDTVFKTLVGKDLNCQEIVSERIIRIKRKYLCEVLEGEEHKKFLQKYNKNMMNACIELRLA